MLLYKMYFLYLKSTTGRDVSMQRRATKQVIKNIIHKNYSKIIMLILNLEKIKVDYIMCKASQVQNDNGSLFFSNLYS